MKKYALISAVALASTVFSTNAQEVVNSDSTGFKFTDVKVAKSTPVTNQNKSGTCWCFSANTFLENEIIKATGKEVNLSEMFVVYKCYHDKAVRYIRTNGQIHFEQGGSHLDVPYIWERYGMMPEEAYKGLEYGEAKHDHYEMTDGLKAYIDALKNRKKAKYSTAWLKGLDGILDAYLGEIPATFTVDGKEYTSKSYAESLGIDMNDYVAITSFTHHPFYTTFALEVADNWIWGQYHNVKMEEMKAIVDNAIKKGHTVAWAADVSEKGWQWKNGVALMPAEKTADTLEGTELARWTALSDKDREKERYNFHGYVPEIKVKNLAQIVLEMLSSLNSMKKSQERLIEITADGIIDDDEIKDFVFIQKELERISITVETLQLWVEQMIAENKIDKEKYAKLISE